MCTPANTPATPPNFPDTLLAFSKMSTNASNTGSSPVAGGLNPSSNGSALNSSLESKSPNPISPLVTHNLPRYHHQFNSPSNLVMRSA